MKSLVWAGIQCDGVIAEDMDSHKGRACEAREMTAVSKPRRETSAETNPANTLISDFQPPEP